MIAFTRRILFSFALVCAVAVCCSRAEAQRRVSDEELLRDFKARTPDYEKLVASIEQGTGPALDHFLGTYFEDRVDAALKQKLGILTFAREFNGCRQLLIVDRRIEDNFDVYSEDRGYLYVDQRPCASQMADGGALDSVKSRELIEEHGVSEGWRYRKINEHWYLFVHQFYQTFLH